MPFFEGYLTNFGKLIEGTLRTIPQKAHAGLLYFQVNQAAYNGLGTNKAPIALYHIAVMQ